jgi:molecular chaperone DnaK (HSP70)
MGRIIGIDLGTTNSVGAYWRKRRARPIYSSTGSPFIPSVVMIERGNRIVGQDAKHQIGRSNNIVYSIKRFIGRSYNDKEVQHTLRQIDLGYEIREASNGEVEVQIDGRYYSPVEISAMILEKIKDEAEVTLDEDVTHAVITVPAYFGQRQKNATRRAGHLAGLQVSRIINEPTAAALAFGVESESNDPRLVLVYDLGGGTFDVSILMISGGDFDVLHIDGDNLLGGDDFDQCIVDEMLGEIQRECRGDLIKDQDVRFQLKREAERAKINLSREERTKVLRPAITQTRDGKPIDLDYTITRKHFEGLVGDLVQRTLDITYRALEDASFEEEDIDHVLLVGGMTRMPLIRQGLKEVFGHKIEIDVDPMQCVGLGAAVQTTVPIEWLCPHCQTVNNGTEDVCHSCNRHRDTSGEQESPHILCDECGKPNQQGQKTCWNCGATIGAVFTEGESARIQDITSKHLGIETEDGSGFGVVIEKGALYPTDEPHRREFYISNLGQEYYRTPVYELERKETPREDWECIGEIINDDLPPGLPKGTPIVVEMSIDGDGVLTVQSYVKRDREKTLSEESFQFIADLEVEKKPFEALGTLEAFGLALEVIAQEPSLGKYLVGPNQRQAAQLANEASKVLDQQDEAEASELLERIFEYIDNLPVPTWDLFLAKFAMNQPQTSAMDRSRTEHTITQMEKAIAEQNIDAANKHLERLRHQTKQMFDKLPSDLLRKAR